jgi:replicative DNA helicase
MTLVPALDLRPARDDGGVAHAPSNIEAEQALLGTVLFDNSAYERLSDNLRPHHFYEPFHARLFEAMEDYIRKGMLAEPIVLMERFRRDPAFEELGGLRYLADLVDRAPPAANAADYGRLIYDLALRRDLIRIGGEISNGANTDAETDARDQIEHAEAQLYALAENGSSSTGFINFSDALRGAIEMAAEAYDRDGGLAGMSCGLIDLDQKLGGLHPSDLLILAGRPSMGKTALATNIAFHVARHYAWEPQPDGTKKTVNGGVVAFFSLEMSAEQLAMRLLAEASGVSSDRLRKGEIDASEFGRVRDAAMEIQESPLYIDATGGLSIAKMVARARRLKRQVGLDLIVVDYLQLLTTDGSKGDNRVQEVSMITQGLKALAKELAVPILALSQLSRQVENREDKKPQLSDLRESGSIEQDADAVMFVYRESYYLGRAEPNTNDAAKHLEWQEKMDQVDGMAEVIIGKQRHGPIGTVKLAFNADLTKFGNLARDGRFDVR